jgi:tetratricopeptide (TPR) repeat protein
MCYHRRMLMTAGNRVLKLAAASVLIALAGPAVSAADDPLARARTLYNQRQFEQAVNAADQARLTPSRSDAANLIAARAYLERYRESAASEDLTNARDRLRNLNPQRFATRERAEYVIGLGETLYFEGAFGAAANVFDSALQSHDSVPGDARERLLDWWATAVDREAKPRPDIERQGAYQRIRERMHAEIATHPASGTAPYWLAAAARAQGDVQSAWDAAQAGWVRAPLVVADRGAALRADLDRLVLRAIVPDRAKATAQSPEALRAEWERFKERWQ